MKNILTAFFISVGLAIALLAAPQSATAQTTDQRTTTTRITDLLAKMPAANKEDLQTNLQNTTALGEEGLTKMALLLAAPGATDNTRVEYALGGYSYYTTQKGNEALKAGAARAYSKALSQTTDPECKAYLIRQLEITGGDDAIPTLKPYLTDERLCDPAARALVKINSAVAGKTLLEALPNASGKRQITLIQALGDLRYTAAATTLNKLAKSKDPARTKAIYYALGRIGSPSSETILANAAATAAFQYDAPGATLDYIDYIRRLALTNPAQADKAARSLFTKTSTTASLPAHTAALKLIVEIEGDKSLPTLLTAVDDKDASYREATLKYALLLPDDASAAAWTDKLRSSEDATVKAAIITMLGTRRQISTLPAVQFFLNDKDDSIRISAIRAAGLIGQEQALPALLKALKNPKPTDIAEIKRSLLIMKGKGVTSAVAAALPSVSVEAKVALIDVLAARAAAPDDQRLLMLRNAMESAKTTAQQQAILGEVQHCHTFLALVFAGKYLDDPALQQQAAIAVMNIADSNKEWNGPVIRDLLEKTIKILQGPDADHQKQAIRKYLEEMPAGEGIVPLFNGHDLTGWKGLVEDPIKRAHMNAKTLQKAQAKADEDMRKSWLAKDGNLEFSGSGENLCTIKKYGDFEMFVDWKIDPDGDAGIYLRGSPQVQIWDTSRHDVGAQVGSGGLYNNSVYPSKPLVLADNAIGDWNTFHIIMKGDRVTVWLNGQLVVNNIILENYWDRKQPIFPTEQIELQAHGRHVAYRDLYIREFPRPEPYTLNKDEKKEGFKLLFDGTNMFQWTGNTTDYTIEDDAIAIHPKGGGHGNLYTVDEYQDFVYRFEFKLTPGANNGIGIRAPLEGDAAYVGMEIQVLDNEADMYRQLHDYQYHGSVYGIIPAKRGFLKPVGEWNTEEITAVGNHIKVVLNGTTILDGDITDAIRHGTLDHRDHPGLKNVKGHLGFLGHGDVVMFRHMRVLKK